MASNSVSKSQSERVDVEALMLRIREDIAAAVKEEGNSRSSKSKLPRGIGRASDLPGNGVPGRETIPVVHSEELNSMNAEWHNWVQPVSPESHRKFIGPVIVRIKQFIVDAVWHYMLPGYFEREKRFNMNLVRHLNAVARYIDVRDAEVFWQIVKKLDSDNSALTERVDRLFDDACAISYRTEAELKKEIRELRQQIEFLNSREPKL